MLIRFFYSKFFDRLFLCESYEGRPLTWLYVDFIEDDIADFDRNYY